MFELWTCSFGEAGWYIGWASVGYLLQVDRLRWWSLCCQMLAGFLGFGVLGRVGLLNFLGFFHSACFLGFGMSWKILHVLTVCVWCACMISACFKLIHNTSNSTLTYTMSFSNLKGLCCLVLANRTGLHRDLFLGSQNQSHFPSICKRLCSEWWCILGWCHDYTLFKISIAFILQNFKWSDLRLHDDSKDFNLSLIISRLSTHFELELLVRT